MKSVSNHNLTGNPVMKTSTSPSLLTQFNFNSFLKFSGAKLFYDSQLHYNREFYLLNRRSSIEELFLKELIEFTNSLTISEMDRINIIDNIYRFSREYNVVNRYSLISPTVNPAELSNDIDDDDENNEEEEQEEEEEEEDYTDDELCSDFENMILDELEMVHFINSLHGSGNDYI